MLIRQLGFDIVRLDHSAEFSKLLNFLEPKETNILLQRVGGDGDGAYLVPKELEKIDFCLSPGSNKEWSFEKDLYDRFKIKSAIMDRKENQPKDLYRELTFSDSWLGPYDDFNHTSINSWINELGLDSSSNLMLQMDIEGAEYQVLSTLPEKTLEKFAILIIEFHYTNRFSSAENFRNHYAHIFDRLQKNYITLHFHPNNCCGIWKRGKMSLPTVFELTLIRKDLVKEVIGNRPIPHNLDMDCVPERASLTFKFR